MKRKSIRYHDSIRKPNDARKPTTSMQTFNRQHSRSRAIERFGLNIGKGRQAELARRIQEGQDVRRLYSCSATRDAYAILFEDHVLPVVYSDSQGTIVTFLPPESIDHYKHKLPDEWLSYHKKRQ